VTKLQTYTAPMLSKDFFFVTPGFWCFSDKSLCSLVFISLEETDLQQKYFYYEG